MEYTLEALKQSTKPVISLLRLLLEEMQIEVQTHEIRRIADDLERSSDITSLGLAIADNLDPVPTVPEIRTALEEVIRRLELEPLSVTQVDQDVDAIFEELQSITEDHSHTLRLSSAQL